MAERIKRQIFIWRLINKNNYAFALCAGVTSAFFISFLCILLHFLQCSLQCFLQCFFMCFLCIVFAGAFVVEVVALAANTLVTNKLAKITTSAFLKFFIRVLHLKINKNHHTVTRSSPLILIT